jgi:CUB domain
MNNKILENSTDSPFFSLVLLLIDHEISPRRFNSQFQILILEFNDFYTDYQDYIQVFDGTNESAPLLATVSGYYYGGSPPPSVTTTQQYMFVRFTSNYWFTNRGFNASYRAAVAGIRSYVDTNSACMCELLYDLIVPSTEMQAHIDRSFIPLDCLRGCEFTKSSFCFKNLRIICAGCVASFHRVSSVNSS